jgi:ATP-dependent protease Clp ATPase subunit
MPGTTGQICSFCSQSVSETDTLYIGPAGIAICPACVTTCEQILAPTPHDDAAAVRITQRIIPHEEPATSARLHCSFCGRQQADVERLIAGPHGVFICDICVRRAI